MIFSYDLPCFASLSNILYNLTTNCLPNEQRLHIIEFNFYILKKWSENQQETLQKHPAKSQFGMVYGCNRNGKGYHKVGLKHKNTKKWLYRYI